MTVCCPSGMHHPRLLLKPLFNSFLYISSFCILCVSVPFLCWFVAVLEPSWRLAAALGNSLAVTVFQLLADSLSGRLARLDVVSMLIRLHPAHLAMLEVIVLAWVQWNMRREPMHDPVIGTKGLQNTTQLQHPEQYSIIGTAAARGCGCAAAQSSSL